MRRTALLAVALAVLSPLGACTANSSPADEAREGTLRRPTREVSASDLPPRLKNAWERWMNEPEGGGTAYRVGDLDTTLIVWSTTHGDVFVDQGGGGMILAEDCRAVDDLVRSGRHFDGHAASCLDGERSST